MKKIVWGLLVLMLILGASCRSESDFVSIKISTQIDNSEGKALYTIPEYDVNPDLFVPQIREGNLIASATPDIMIMDIVQIALYVPIDKSSATAGYKNKLQILPVHVETASTDDSGNTSGDYNIIPNRVNCLSTKGMASVSVPKSILNQQWDGLLIQFDPSLGNNDYYHSIIGVRKSILQDKGIDITRIVNNADVSYYEWMTYRDYDEDLDGDPDFIWFNLSDCIPYGEYHFLHFMCFQSGIEQLQILNYEQNSVNTVYGCEGTRGGSVACVYPMETIDFSNLQTPEIVVSIDSYNLLEFYEQSDGSIYVYLNKKNPIPLRVYVEDYKKTVDYIGSFEIADIKDAAPIDCCSYDWEKANVLSFSMPNYSGIEAIEIYRSTNDYGDPSKPSLSVEERNNIQESILADSQKIFTGYDNVFVDYTDISEYKHYRYWACSVDEFGHRSYLRKFIVKLPWWWNLNL